MGYQNSNMNVRGRHFNDNPTYDRIRIQILRQITIKVVNFENSKPNELGLTIMLNILII